MLEGLKRYTEKKLVYLRRGFEEMITRYLEISYKVNDFKVTVNFPPLDREDPEFVLRRAQFLANHGMETEALKELGFEEEISKEIKAKEIVIKEIRVKISVRQYPRPQLIDFNEPADLKQYWENYPSSYRSQCQVHRRPQDRTRCKDHSDHEHYP